MKIKLEKFGKMLISRPAGHDAYLTAKAYILPHKQELITLDFSGVEVFTPSWADEFITPLKKQFPNKVRLIHTKNSSVEATLEIIKS